MKSIPELNLKPEEIFGNYGYEWHDPLLEYVEIMAEEYHPSNQEEKENNQYISRAINDFAHRYLSGDVNVNSMQKYFDSKNIIDSIKAMGYEPDKFWYLLMFIYDYSLGFTIKGININESPKVQLKRLIDAIIQNVNTFNEQTGDVTFVEPSHIALTLGKNQIIVSDPLALYWMASACYHELKLVENGSIMDTSITKLTVCNGHLKYDPLTATVHISYFVKMFFSFFELKPPEKGVQKKGSLIFYNKKLLVSKLIYLTRLSTNESFDSTDENIKGFIKQSKELEKHRINGLYL